VLFFHFNFMPIELLKTGSWTVSDTSFMRSEQNTG
jgi:hypothetical protein